MNTHHRFRAVRADRHTTTFTLRTVITVVVATFLIASCGSEEAADSVEPTPPVSQGADGILSETVEAMGALDESADEPDYTEAELEVLLDVDEPDELLDPTSSEPEPLDAGSPEAAIQGVEARLDEPTAPGGADVLDRIEPVDDGLTGTIFGIRDGRRINEVGEANRLDEAAALACGNVEIAVTALDDGRPDAAADHLRAASTMAAETTVSAVSDWSSILDQASDDVALDGSPGSHTASLIAFLTTCTQGGYEL